MNKVLRVIGGIVFASFMYSVPIVTACSFCLGWDSFWAYILTIVSLGQLILLAVIVIAKSDDEDNG